MVSLESRNGFLSELNSNDDAKTMIAFVYGASESALQGGRRTADRIACAVMKDNKAEFQKVVDELGERKLNSSAEWIHDDYLAFALTVASRKFDAGLELTRNVLRAQQLSASESKKLHNAISQFALGSNAIDGEYSFAKLVLRELASPARLSLNEARVVYTELAGIDDLDSLSTLSRLLAIRAFDIVVQKNVEPKLDSSATIAAEIQSRAEDFSIGDWWKIATAMKPKFLWTLIIGFASLIGGAFWAGSHLGGDHKPDQSSGNATSPTLPNVIPAIEPGTLNKIQKTKAVDKSSDSNKIKIQEGANQ